MQVTVPLGGAKVTPAVTEVFLRARRIAEAEGSLTGMQHLFLALLYCPTFYKILVNSGCDIELFKEYAVATLGCCSFSSLLLMRDP